MSPLKKFIAGFIPRRQRHRAPVLTEADEAARVVSLRRDSDGSSAVEICIDARPNTSKHVQTRPNIPQQAWAESVEVGRAGFSLSSPDGRTQIVGSGHFGVLACSKEDFMQIQTSVMNAFSRAEARFGDDEDFAEEIEGEIDILFDEFEQLKDILVAAQRGECGTDVERDVTRLKTRIHGIVCRINEHDVECSRKTSSSGPTEDSDGLEACAARGIDKLCVT